MDRITRYNKVCLKLILAGILTSILLLPVALIGSMIWSAVKPTPTWNDLTAAQKRHVLITQYGFEPKHPTSQSR